MLGGGSEVVRDDEIAFEKGLNVLQFLLTRCVGESGGVTGSCKLKSSRLARKCERRRRGTERNRTKVGLHNYLYTVQPKGAYIVAY